MGPFAEAAIRYGDMGYFPLPVAAHGKELLVKGYTGRTGKWPTELIVKRWIRAYPDANIAIRLPKGIIGIDVDAYDGKQGAQTLAALEADLGPLPKGWASTSRDDGISGIRLFRLTEKYDWDHFRGVAGPGIEIITWYHRYCIVAPSIHPSGNVYKWVKR